MKGNTDKDFPPIDQTNFNQLIENVNEVFCLVDKASKKVIYLSPTFEELFGFQASMVIEKPDSIFKYIHPNDVEQISLALDRLNNLNDPLAEEFRIIRPDGTIRWVWVRANPVSGSSGEIYRFACIVEDITKRQLADQELKTAIAKAEESDKLKTAFLANISHELRTPMNGILGFSELMCREDVTQEKRVLYTDLITQSANQLLGIVNDILDLSKIETGQLVLTKELTDLGQLMTETCIVFKDRAVAKNLAFNLARGIKDESMVNTDIKRLQQVLTILFDNAIKFTTSGKITIGYSLIGRTIEFYVEDTGIGIKKEFQKRIFGHFQQEDYDSSRQYGGTGIGLSLAKSIVELMGGKIWFVSTHGEGSTFYFAIPSEISQPELNIDLIYGSTEYESQKNEKVTILIAEDENLNYLFYEEIFENTNIKLIRAYDGAEAVKKSEIHPEINLILMDIKMPIMNGLEATKRIRVKKPTLPIIAVTAFAMDDDMQNALLAGCNDYLAKPLKPDFLLDFIKKYISFIMY